VTDDAVTDDAVRANRIALGLAVLLGLAGSMHFVNPRFFDVIVPRVMPGSARAWTYASGVAELVCAALIARPRTRRVGGLMATLVFIAVFPANVQMAVDWMDRPMGDRAIALGRLPLQIPLVLWARRVAKDAAAT
jgi:uncharacterized membrane protein